MHLLRAGRNSFIGRQVRMALGLVWFGVASQLAASTNNVIGTYANWPTTWVLLSALNDTDDGLANQQLDFVGDSSSAGAYYAYNSEYVFFRQRVDLDTVSALSVFHDAHIVLIDLVGQDYNTSTKTLQSGSDGYPDYGFAWDSKSNDNTKHGLEMVVRSTAATYWNGINMDDIDYNAAQKLANDINGGGRTTDGYLRVIDQQATANFGNTTFIDYAVKWSYLNANTGLASNQVWRVAFGSISDATDHNNLTADIAGGANPSSLSTSGWIQFSSNPLSSGVELRAYQGADGVYVEFVAYDVEEDGTITLILRNPDGTVAWSRTVAVEAGPRQVCRFRVPGLVVGGLYDFVVRDEVGKIWQAPGVRVGEFAAEMIRMSLAGVTLAFSSLPERNYEIQWTANLGTAWRTVTNVPSQGERTSVVVVHPDLAAPSGFFRIRLK